MLVLFKNAQVYDPDYLGKKDILTGGSTILAINDHLEPPVGFDINIIDCEGLVLIPGLIDSHVHITGGGGEGGPASRMPELQLSMMTDGGVTTVIGCLGTDGITRSVESVLMKVKTLRALGVSAWMYTGAYQVPSPTITGDISKDIALFEEIIGVGEIAISDHRSSVPSFTELARITAQARVAGMIGGKAGIVNIHMGDARDPFRPLHEVVAGTMMGYKQFVPTHCNRNPYIFEDAREYGKKGFVDITASSYPYDPDSEIKPSKALKQLLESGVPIGHITFTSDGCGSLPLFDAEGKLLKIDMGLPSSILREISEAVLEDQIPLATAIKVATSSPADILKLKGKGYLRNGFDADLLLLDKDFNIKKVMAMGKIMSRSLLLLFFIWFSALTLQAQTTSSPVPAPLKHDFEGILSFLSSDWLEGRETGTRGASMASDYIASMMQLNGLLPCGDLEIKSNPGSPVNPAQTFFQTFKMVRCHVEKSSLELIRNDAVEEPVIIFAQGTDFIVDPVPFGRETEAAVIFVGYGIEAPGKGYNDYAGKDVRNRIVMIVDGYPGHADTTSAAWKKLGRSFEDDFATIRQKLKLAERHGAAAVVFVYPHVLNSKINEPISGEGDDENPRHYLPGDTGRLNIPCFTLGTDAILQLLDGTGIDLPGFEKKSARDLLTASGPMQGKKLRFSVSVRSEEVMIRNVIGMIQGIDTTRNIIIGGHYDHLGVRNGQVFNGADDNASGVAGMLALAKAWSSHPGKPPCNIIFAAWIGEERGKLGSTYFAMHSRLVPRQVSLVINMDMISRSAPEDTGRIGLSIGTRTINEDLRSLAKNINSKLEHPFVLELWDVTGASGSDYRPFSDRKVPILTFHAGFPDEYHTPLDDFARVDLHKMEQILKIVNDCLWETLKNPPAR